VQCHMEYRCDVRCPNVLNCSQHKCGQKCCTGNCGPCPRMCDTNLSCGNHRCQSVCHVGPCQKCPITMEVTCICKELRETVPCGKRYNLVHTVERTCPGLHIQREADCFIEWLHCSQPCGNPSSCGNHKCTLPCHPVTIRRRIEHQNSNSDTSDPSDVVVSEENPDIKDTCEPCALPCLKKERQCKHRCELLCHPGHCPPCEVPIRTQCYCERVRLYLSCWQTSDKQVLSKLRSCGNKCDRKLLECNHLCDQSCHPGKCASEECTKKVNVKCKCSRIKQTWTCDKARAEIKKQNLRTFQYKILPCDDNCKKYKEEQQEQKQREIEEKQKEEEKIDEEPIRIKRRKPQPEDGEDTSKNMIPKRKKPREWYEKPGFVVSVVGIFVIVIIIGMLILKS